MENNAPLDAVASMQEIRERKIALLSTLIERVEAREDRVDQKIQYWLGEVKKWQDSLMK